jgi:hypothetical protein
MDPQTLTELLDVAVLDRLDRIDDLPDDALARSKALRKEGYSAEVTAALLTQARLRKEAAAKLGPFAEDMLFTRDGLAQATRLPVAAHHARRLIGEVPDDETFRIADLGCGIGADSVAFAGMGAHVSAVDADEVTAAIAAFNLRHLPDASVEHARAEDVDLTGFDALWFDPARRTIGKADKRGSTARITDPEAFSPSLSWVVDQAMQAKAAGVKLGPALDHDLVPDEAEAQWVSHHGEVVEVCLYFGTARQRPGRSALIMGERTLLVHEDDLPESDEEGFGELGRYLLEPDGAIVRAGLVTALCAPLQARRLNPIDRVSDYRRRTERTGRRRSHRLRDRRRPSREDPEPAQGARLPRHRLGRDQEARRRHRARPGSPPTQAAQGRQGDTRVHPPRRSSHVVLLTHPQKETP